MKTLLSVLAGATLAGIVGAPSITLAATYRNREPATTGYGVCAKGPCLRVTHWRSEGVEKGTCRKDGSGHGQGCSCPHCNAH